jgi:hypothetical protein
MIYPISDNADTDDVPVASPGIHERTTYPHTAGVLSLHIHNLDNNNKKKTFLNISEYHSLFRRRAAGWGTKLSEAFNTRNVRER